MLKRVIRLRLFVALLLALLLCPPPHVTYAQFPIDPAEQAALVAFYNATGGPGWTHQDGWLGATSPCDYPRWYGVTCTTGSNPVHIWSVMLPGNNLTGVLPSALTAFPYLNQLWLPDNHLTGGVPPQVGQLTNLQFLSLSGNALWGRFPRPLAICRS